MKTRYPASLRLRADLTYYMHEDFETPLTDAQYEEWKRLVEVELLRVVEDRAFDLYLKAIDYEPTGFIEIGGKVMTVGPPTEKAA